MERFLNYQPVAWEQIPDFGLYMDQVITYVEKQLAPLYGEAAGKLLTPAMINNYVKSGLVPRPQGKKYDRAQLALMLMVATLKQSASIEDVARLVKIPEGSDMRAVYEDFISAQHRIIRTVFEQASGEEANAMRFAIEASAYRLACEVLLKGDQEIAKKTDA